MLYVLWVVGLGVSILAAVFAAGRYESNASD